MLSCSMSDLHTAELDNLIPQGSVIDFFKGEELTLSRLDHPGMLFNSLTRAFYCR